MKTKSFLNLCGISFVFLMLIIMIGCKPNNNPASSQGSPFTLTNVTVGSETHQVVLLTNRIAIQTSQSNLVVSFADGAHLIVVYELENPRPLSILLELPASGDVPARSILDINADGLPDIRELEVSGEPTKEILYRGEWVKKYGDNKDTAIMIDGQKAAMRFDGQRWVRR